MLAQRASILLAAAVALIPAQAGAQDNSAGVGILRECARIDDPNARLACYDNNIRSIGGVARTTIPGQVRVQGGGAVVADNAPQGFGREMIRTPNQPRGPAGAAQSIRPKITAVRERQPGIYLVTIEDGAQWLFADGVAPSFRVPRPGSIVEIERGALGSFLMRIDGQEPVQVRRVQ